MLARFRARGDVRRRAACAERGPQGDRSCGPFAFWGGRGVASGVARDAGRFMRREASAWFTGSAPGCAEGCYPRGVYLRFGDANA